VSGADILPLRTADDYFFLSLFFVCATYVGSIAGIEVSQ
jgi:hypothetical protein